MALKAARSLMTLSDMRLAGKKSSKEVEMSNVQHPGSSSTLPPAQSTMLPETTPIREVDHLPPAASQIFGSVTSFSSFETRSSQLIFLTNHVSQGLPNFHSTNLERVSRAVKAGEFKELAKMLSKLGTDGFAAIIREHDGKNNSPLHYAALNDDVKMMKLLIGYGANVEDVGEGGRRPLHFAVASRGKEKYSGDENPEHQESSSTRENAVTLLLANGADVNSRDTKGRSTLHIASVQGNMEIFIALLAAPEITLDDQDRRGMTALAHATQAGNTDVALLLLNKGANPHIADINGDTPMHIAVRHSRTMIVMTLFEIAEGKGEINKLLMSQNLRGTIPIYDAVKSGNKELFQLCMNHIFEHDSDPVEVEKLINFAGDNNDTLVHVACASGNIEILQTLLSRGARLDLVNNDSETPLHLACARNYEAIALCLLEHGADANIRNSSGHTPLEVAANHGSYHTLMSLLQTLSMAVGGHSDEATELVRWAAGHNKAETLRKILDYEFRLHDFSDDGVMSFIMDAVKNNFVETVLVLVRWNRSSVDYKDTLGNTPLHYAAEGGCHDIAEHLLKAKADVNAKNYGSTGGTTPLHYAAANGWVRTARILLDAEANINERDSEKMTPLHHACANGRFEMAEMLMFGKGGSEKMEMADVVLCDRNDHNCLDHAIDNDHENIARMMMGHKKWRELLSVSSVDEETSYRTTPMRKLIVSMPAVAKIVLDQCITVTGEHPKLKDAKAEYYFEFLEDAFSSWMKPTDVEESRASMNGNTKRGSMMGVFNSLYRRVSARETFRVVEDELYTSNDRLKKKAMPYIMDAMERAHNHPLQIMASSQHVELLEHPVVGALLKNKYEAVGRYVFFCSLILYLVYLGMLTGYVLVTPPNYYFRSVNHTKGYAKVVWWADGEERWVKSLSPKVLSFFDRLGPVVIIALASLNLCREAAQAFVQGLLSYLKHAENWLELFLYIAAILFALPFSRVQYIKDGFIKKSWQWECGSLAVFLSWINLLLFIRDTKLGIYVIMFLDIIKTFLRFCIILFLFIVAFGLAFYTLLMNQNPFNTLGYSMAKTFVMMIGELDFADIFFAQNYLGTENTLETDGEAAYFMNFVPYSGLTYVVFTVFLVVMSILMMNMLVGLAVDDIQAIQEKAKLHNLTMQVNNVMEVQLKFPVWVWRTSVVRRKTFACASADARLKRWLHRFSSNRIRVQKAIQVYKNRQDPLQQESPEDAVYDKIRDSLTEMSWAVERVTLELIEGGKKKTERLEQIRASQSTLRDRCDTMQATQERLEDRLDQMSRKMDALLKRLKVKQKEPK
ncbi:transient receptor potential cation channel subfamily A member 1-like [Diadema antillarum]|uniref:transient receptor potential cation channel subfamily A member 1-like n=1 Tax=Diadema antillarum TaxID=105358 RepID=UPI003A849B74